MLILGLVGTIAVGTRQASDMLKSRTGFSIIMTNEATQQEISSINQALSSTNGINTFSFSSALDNMEAWNRDNGENVLEILDTNPFPADFTVRVAPDYAGLVALQELAARFANLPGVDSISLNSELVSNLNHNISMVTWILTGIAAGLLLISFVLINNTVRLTVYSRRFLIHTMKLVGATGSFIRRPFVRTGMLSGITAGLLASLLLAGLIAYVHAKHPLLAGCLPWLNLVWLFPAMLLAATAVCATASTLATNRYLRLDYDDLF